MADWIIETPAKELGAVPRTLLGGASRFLGGLEGLGTPSRASIEDAIKDVAAMTKTAPIKLQEPQTRTEQLFNFAGLTPEELQPQGTLESLGQNVVAGLPYALAGGLGAGQLKSALQRLGAGSALATGAEELGLGPEAQTAAQFLGELGTGIAQKGGFPSGVKAHKKELYEKTKAAIKPREQAANKNTLQALDSIEKAMKTSTDQATHNKLEFIRDQVARHINEAKGTIDLESAWELKKSLAGNKGGKVGRLSGELREGLMKDLEKHSELNPEFWKHLKPADALHSAEKMNPLIVNAFNAIPGISKIRQVEPVAKALDDVLLFVPRLWKHQAFRQLYGNLARATFAENIPQMAKYGNALNKFLEKERPQEEEIESSGWIIENP